MDDEDVNFIWDTIQQIQVIFHPEIAPFGKFDFEKFFETKRNKPIILFVDRNILSGLLKFCEKGSLQDKGESQIAGLIMAWAEMNDIAISAGLAVQERATQTQSQEEGLKELQKFLEIFDAYPGQTWLRIAEGQETEITPIIFSGTTAKDITVDYSSGSDHYYMMVASMLHLVKLYRKRDMKPVDKIIDFLGWTYDNGSPKQMMASGAIFSNMVLYPRRNSVLLLLHPIIPIATIELFSIPSKQKSWLRGVLQLIVGITVNPLLCQKAPHQRFLATLSICRHKFMSAYVEKSGDSKKAYCEYFLSDFSGLL